MAQPSSSVISLGSYKHQGNWITSIAVANDVLVSGSRDKTVCMWKMQQHDQANYLKPKFQYTGHNHFVEEIALSSDGQYALSASWDKTLRLWDLNGRKSIAQFVGHKHDVLSVALSRGNRQIISASRDKTIKLWNIHGECKYTTPELPEWISTVKFGMTNDLSPIVSAGYDQLIRVWDRATFAQKYALTGHTGFINTVAISPDSTLVASGGYDHSVNLSDITIGKHLFALKAGDIVNNICFSPNRFWISVATDSALKVFCLSKKQCIIDLKLQPTDLEELAPADPTAAAKKAPKTPKCLTSCFSSDGLNLFAGYSDGHIRCWKIPATQK